MGRESAGEFTRCPGDQLARGRLSDRPLDQDAIDYSETVAQAEIARHGDSTEDDITSAAQADKQTQIEYLFDRVHSPADGLYGHTMPSERSSML